MRAVIMAGGAGTRLRPYTTVIPKPLVPVFDRPILHHVLHRLDAFGFTDVHICVGYLGSLIEAYFSQADFGDSELRITWHREQAALGTAGALRSIDGLDEPFLFMNGDVLTSLDLGTFYDFHCSSGAAMTVATGSKSVQIDLGVVHSNGDWISGYSEKPVLKYQVSMGVYVADPRVLRYVPEGVFQVPDLVQDLLAAKEPVAHYRSDDIWYDIGTIAEYERATADEQLYEIVNSVPTRLTLAS